MVGHGGSSAGSYLADPTSPIPSHCASIVVTSTLTVNWYVCSSEQGHWICVYNAWYNYAISSYMYTDKPVERSVFSVDVLICSAQQVQWVCVYGARHYEYRLCKHWEHVHRKCDTGDIDPGEWFLILPMSLSLSNITQKVMNGFRWNFMEGPRMVKGTIEWLNFGSDMDHHVDC